MIPAATSASTAASSSGSVSWPPQRARNASQAPAKHFFFSHISCPNFSKNLSRHIHILWPVSEPAEDHLAATARREIRRCHHLLFQSCQRSILEKILCHVVLSGPVSEKGRQKGRSPFRDHGPVLFLIYILGVMPRYTSVFITSSFDWLSGPTISGIEPLICSSTFSSSFSCSWLIGYPLSKTSRTQR